MADYIIPKAVDFKNLSGKARKALDLSRMQMQLKYDGCACRMDFTATDFTVRSADGKPVRSMDEQARSIQAQLNGQPAVIVGEVWHANLAQQFISGEFRRHTQSTLGFVIFDGYTSHPDDRYSWRHSALRALLPAESFAVSFGVPASLEEAEAKARSVSAGFDGIILRDYDAPFNEGRSKGDIVKIKPLMTFDLRVVGFEADTGEKTGRPTVALLCAWKYGGTQKVATGLNHEQQADPAAFLGSIIEVAGMGLTADGKLREPRFLSVRHDKLNADF